MRKFCITLAFLLVGVIGTTLLVEARKQPSRSSSSSSSIRPQKSSGRPTSKRRPVEEEDVEPLGLLNDEEELLYDEQQQYDEDEEEYEEVVPRHSSKKVTKRKSSSTKQPKRKVRFVEEDYYEEEEEFLPVPTRKSRRKVPPAALPSRRSARRGSASTKKVVPYAPTAFTRGLSAIRSSIPDAASIRDAAVNAAAAAKQTTTKLSSNIYREVKGLTSSELEQVMLKATRPDDTPVKGKHVERLVGVTYQISARYDIYDAVLRKLWSKMAERDWRTTTKALYILHRFSADGAPDHQPALKARLRELRRTPDPKRKDKYFNSKQLLAGDSTPDNLKFRAFMARYAHYVLLRAQCFGGMFAEIRAESSSKKPITSTSLRIEHLEAAQMLLKAGSNCALKDGEVCENTAIAVERVVADLIGLTAAVATALNRALKSDGDDGDDDDDQDLDYALIKKWCQFYADDLLPQTKSMVKKSSPKLDAFGLFLPSRMGASVSPEVLQKGLKGADTTTAEEEEKEGVDEVADAEITSTGEVTKAKKEVVKEEIVAKAVKVDDKDDDEATAIKMETKTVTRKEVDAEDAVEEDEYDEYDYEEEEYYDEEP